MLTASRALAFAQAEPLPDVPALQELTDYGIRLRRGQLIMIAGQPNCGKSPFAEWLVVQVKLRTMYVCADMDAHTAVTRMAAIVTGDKVDQIAKDIYGAGADYYADAMSETPVWFLFEPEPHLEDIADEMSAYVETWDDYPEFIVVDNLMNIDAGMGEGYQNQLAVMNELQRMARLTGACVLVLHHTSEGTSRPSNEPQPRKEIQGKVAQRPEIVLTVAYDPTEKTFKISPVKNRSGGTADPTGRLFLRLSSDPERCQFSKYRPKTYGWGGGDWNGES